MEVTQRLVDQVDDHFGRNHGVYGSALSDMALMMKAMGKHQEATEVYLKALEVCRSGASPRPMHVTLYWLSLLPAAAVCLAPHSKRLLCPPHAHSVF